MGVGMTHLHVPLTVQTSGSMFIFHYSKKEISKVNRDGVWGKLEWNTEKVK